MKFSCSRDSLLNAINIVSKAVSSRTTLPILECILLTASEDGLKLTANDMELAIESSYIDADIDETGKIAVDARFFSDIIRKVNGDTVKILNAEKANLKYLVRTERIFLRYQRLRKMLNL